MQQIVGRNHIEERTLMNDETAKTQEAPSTPNSAPPTLIKDSGSQGGPVRAKWIWWWAGFLTLWTLADYGLKRFVLLHGATILDFDGARVWEQIAIPMLLIKFLGILVTLAICSWWFSRSKLLRRRPTVLQVFGYLFFGLGTFQTSCVGTGLVFDTAVHFVSRGNKGWVGYIFRGSQIDEFIVACAAMIAIAYFLVFRRGGAPK